MLRYIKDLPDHVVGIHAVGEVTKEDYEKVLYHAWKNSLHARAR